MKTANQQPVMKATSGNQYMINLTTEAQDKAQLPGIQAQFYDLLKMMYPEKLESLKQDGSLKQFLNNKAELFHQQMETRLMKLEEKDRFTQIPSIQSEVIREILEQQEF